MHEIWNDNIMDYLIYVRRVSLKGLPHIKGLFILKDESTPLPSEFEVHPISNDDVLACVHHQYKEEQKFENNAIEYGRPPFP